MAAQGSVESDRLSRIEPAFQIVLVCTGNRFRSPIAEAVLRELGNGLPLDLQSYGTRDVGTAAPLIEAFEAARTHGLDLSAHRARPLTGADLSGADLVLGFERTHIATAVVDAGAPPALSFLLPELAELLPSVARPAHFGTVAAAREIVSRAAQLRATSAGRESEHEMRDPLGGPPRGFSESAARIEELCMRLLRGLFGRGEQPVAVAAAPRRSS